MERIYKFVTTCGRGIRFMRFFEARRVSAVSKAVCIVGEDAAGVRRRADVIIDFE